MDNYKIYLLKQFKDSQGIKSNLSEEKCYMIDFVPWIIQQKSIGNNYTEFLKYLELPFDNYDCAEVGKSEFDSVVKPYRTTIITPYTEGFEIIDSTRIINGTFEVQGTTPTIIRQADNQIISRTIPQTSIRTYMTQNPYNQSDIANWYRLHNSKEAGIILGAYGSIYDKDIEEKIEGLEQIKDNLEDDIQEAYEELNGEYYYVLSSNIKVKRKTKTK